MSEKNIIVEKSKAFALRTINLYRYLTENHKIYPIAVQVLRSGTSIGAMYVKPYVPKVNLISMQK